MALSLAVDKIDAVNAYYHRSYIYYPGYNRGFFGETYYGGGFRRYGILRYRRVRDPEPEEKPEQTTKKNEELIAFSNKLDEF